MVVYLIWGITLGFAAGVQPGPMSTYIVSQTLANGWRRTLPAVMAPLISDGPIALVTLMILSKVPPDFVHVLRLVGGAFILYLAWGAWKTWRAYDDKTVPVAQSSRQSVLKAATVNLLNPNPYLGWSLVIGPLMLKGWRETPTHGIAMLVGFYGTVIATMAATVFLFSLARKIGPKVTRVSIGLSALALACFGVYQLVAGAFFRS